MGKGIGGHTLPQNGRTNDWITPQWVIEGLGGWKSFDLDPCSCDPQPWRTAKEQVTAGGLDRSWHGRVWLNPPYGRQTCEWLRRLSEYGRGTALIFARTDTEMFHRYVFSRATGLFFIEGRLRFYRPDGIAGPTNAGGPSVLVSYGKFDASVLEMARLGGVYVGL